MRKNKLMSKIGAVALSVVMAAGSFVVMPASEVKADETVDLADGLIGEYLFNGDWKDSVTSNVATAYDAWGDAHVGTADDPMPMLVKDSVRGNVAELNGTWVNSGHIKLNMSYVQTADISSGFSVSMWVKSGNSKGTTYPDADAALYNAHNDMSFFNIQCGGGFVDLINCTTTPWINDATGNWCDRTITENKLSATEFTNIVVTLDAAAGTMLTYVNGTLATETTLGGGTVAALLATMKSGSTDIMIGQVIPWFADQLWATRGYVDDVRLYNKALSVEEITALQSVAKDTSVSTISIDKTTATVEKDATAQLTATTNTATTINWKSSDEKIAKVDATGKVTAVAAGTATITAYLSDSVKAECKVTVTAPLKGITATDKLSVLKDKTAQIVTTFNPEDTTDNVTVTYTSDKTDVATVDATGKVTAVAAGTANITVTATAGDKTYTAKCVVTVTAEANPITGITATIDKATIDLADDAKTANVKVEYTFKDATKDTTDSKTITYTSSDEKVATVDKNGVVTAVGEGTATITAALENGQKATVTLKVTKTIKIESEIDCTGWWKAHTTGVQVTKEGVKLTFKNTTYDSAKDGWNGPIYVLFTGSEPKINGAGYVEYAVMRGDLFGWTPTANTGDKLADFEKAGNKITSNVADFDDAVWADYLKALKAGQNCTVVAKLVDGGVQVKMTVGKAVSTVTWKVDTTKPVYISLGGELTKLTDIKVSAVESTSNNASSVPTAITKEEVAKMVATVKGATADSVIKLDAISDANEITKVESFKASTLKGLTFQAIDIKLMKGTEAVQPGATVTVTVTVPEALKNAKEIKVFRLDTVDGKDSLTPVKVVEFKDGNVSFETDHFSTYVFAATTVKSGDTAPVVAVVLLACVAAAAVLVSKKRRVTE